MKKRVFVIDTNLLLNYPKLPLHFANENVVIPIPVAEEVDRFKRDPGEKGFSARRVSRLLDILKEKGNLSSGVKINNKNGERYE
jgi:PhoH-like ATPase